MTDTWTSTVERVIAAAHHNGPPGHKCTTNHGHDFRIVVEFTYTEVDDIGWGPDFGKIKKLIDAFDHQDLNMHMVHPSAELFAKFLFDLFKQAFGVTPNFVSVAEGKDNTVVYRRTDP